MVNPPKTAAQVNTESQEGKHLYKVSHHDFEVGEMVDRKYDWSRISKESKFGIETPHNNDGIQVRKTLKWLHDTQQLHQKSLKALFHTPQLLTSQLSQDKSGKISLGELREVCIQFNLPVESELLESLLAYCDVDGDGQINYAEFANFLNWKDKMLPGEMHSTKKESEEGVKENEEKGETSPTRIEKQIDKAVGGWKTSSSQFNAVTGGIRTSGWRAYGVPTIRSDLPAPITRRVADSTNYGDESDAYGLINPSIYSNHGVHEKDFFQPRDQYEVKQLPKLL
ncbi:PREDICTED: EF-hand domain-containing family member B-like [Acropora digitifera]|uniref:EF-hand domain-containing family member B-like n=1 Tax=Acropora digitifera TaxID=70779 RepID=UPI00077A075A|nr:PREDICTED: EF-hand domain-containing family member B-like [Acropora digitifera]